VSTQGQVASSRTVVLTDTDGDLTRPLVVLEADPDRRPHEPEARVALIDHGVPVAEAITTDVAIHNGVWGAAVAS
jgi:hypothetical protein